MSPRSGGETSHGYAVAGYQAPCRALLRYAHSLWVREQIVSQRTKPTAGHRSLEVTAAPSSRRVLGPLPGIATACLRRRILPSCRGLRLHAPVLGDRQWSRVAGFHPPAGDCANSESFRNDSGTFVSQDFTLLPGTAPPRASAAYPRLHCRRISPSCRGLRLPPHAGALARDGGRRISPSCRGLRPA